MRIAWLAFLLVNLSLAASSAVAGSGDRSGPPVPSPPQEAEAEQSEPERPVATGTQNPSGGEAEAPPETPAPETSLPAVSPNEPVPDGLDEIRAEYRSARTAVLMTFPMPGWGQLYADAPFWGVLAFGAEMFFLGNILMENRRQERQAVKRDQETDPNRQATRAAMVDEHGERARDYVWWAAGVYLVVALDAYVSVELADFDRDDPPTPDLDRSWPDRSSDGGGMALQLNFSF